MPSMLLTILQLSLYQLNPHLYLEGYEPKPVTESLSGEATSYRPVRYA